MSRLSAKDKVRVNKDIFRIEEIYELNERNKGILRPDPKNIEEFQKIDWSQFRRLPKLYAKQGEEGIVEELFSDCGGSYKQRVRHYAKIKINDKIKTFRITSLDKI